ncbi:hypothetical protein TSUD_328690 [Trifolium subterraneum]|uniref:Uncharacterized protein n=1 Tax=Trifolium subterraneum TaxID=3900 RepID=A0A2Z6LRC1_TRISU|nr:hypothetical protein TSUD_328690 [Trifolium subterraneum]
MSFVSKVVASWCKKDENDESTVWYDYPLAVCNEGDDDDDDDGGYDYAPAA